jgi:hypothetical protein
VSLRIKEGREEIKNAMREDVWQLGLSPSDPVIDHMGPELYEPTEEASDLWRLVWAFDKYLCKVMQ